MEQPQEKPVEDTTKKECAKPKADVYNSLQDSVQSFNSIGLLQAVNGNIVLRGRNGQRDKIFKLEHAVEKYHDTMATVRHYMLHGIRGWDTLADIAADFKERLKEAVKQRYKLAIPIPDSAKEFIEKDK